MRNVLSTLCKTDCLQIEDYYNCSDAIKMIYIYRQSKKGDTILLSISLLNIDRFSQFFHRRTQLEICNNIINKDSTSPQMCSYTPFSTRGVLKHYKYLAELYFTIFTGHPIGLRLYAMACEAYGLSTKIHWLNNLIRTTKGHQL